MTAPETSADEERAAYIKRIVDAAPPFTEYQRARIAELMRPAREHLAQTGA